MTGPARDIDLDQGLWALAWPVARANAQVLVLGAALLALAELGHGLAPGAGMEDVWSISMSVGQLGVIFLVEISFAFALFPTLLSGGVLSGQSALRAARLPRLAIFLGYSVLSMAGVLVIMTLVAPLLVFLLPSVTLDDPGVFAVAYGAGYFLWTVLLGLMAPDIVSQGRFAPGLTLGWSWSRRGRLAGLVCAGGLPLGIAATWLGLAGRYDEVLLVDLSRTGLVLHAVELMAINLLSVLSTVLASIALAKVYVEVAPPDERIESPRVAEVFD